MEKLQGHRDLRLIKVITGVRRCGKTTVLEAFRATLINSGIGEDQIISVCFEDAGSDELTEGKALFDYIKSRLHPEKKSYIFLDEVRRVTRWQLVVDSLCAKMNCDVYITSSNGYLMTGELAKLLKGRFVEINMHPLSFAEYMSAFPDSSDQAGKFNEYLINSSFPHTLHLSSQKDIRTYLDGIYSSVMLNDIVKRKKIADVSALESVVRFVYENVGSICSSKSIADALHSSGRKISVHTVDSYLTTLGESLMTHKINRFDVKGQQHLKTGEKHYLADVGLRHYLLGEKKADIRRSLENVVFLELLRRGYKMSIGKVGNLEVEFIATNESGIEYYKVAATVSDAKALTRELKPLYSISDHYPKFLLTLDEGPEKQHNGVRQINALDWLLGKGR